MKLAEIIVHVDDMQAQTAFYRDTLGLTPTFESEHWTTFDTGGCTLALHAGGRGRIRLAFGVDDLEVARSALAARGAQLGEVRSPIPGVLVCDGVDPEGNEFSVDSHS